MPCSRVILSVINEICNIQPIAKQMQTIPVETTAVYAVIPALNEVKTIQQVVSSVKAFTPNVVVVDDGSTDNTAQLAAEAGAHTVVHPANRGYDKSIEDGFRYVEQQKNARVIFTFDADGQHSSEVLQELIQPILDNKADIVVGIRPFKARIAEKMLAIYTRHRFGITDPLCGLKAYDVKVYRDIGFFDRISSIGTELVLRSALKGYRIKQIPIPIRNRQDKSRFGESLKGNCKIFRAFLRILLYV